jgi:hypothetical protein
VTGAHRRRVHVESAPAAQRQRVTLSTAAGSAQFTVAGIVSDQQQNGTVLYAPLSTMQSVLHTPDAVNEYWIQTKSSNHHLIDQTNTRLEDAGAVAWRG